MVITPSQNNTIIDLNNLHTYNPRKLNEPVILFEKGTENITLKNFSTKGRNIVINGSGHILENFSVDAYSVGIFVNTYANNITIRKGDIKAGSAGVYLEHGSHHNTIEYCNIHDCGYWVDQPNMLFKLPRLGWDRREGIAVDASQNNLIQNNTLTNNAFAGICLYKNCGELGQKERKEGANRNIIRNNIITGSKVDIWNKAREWRDMLMWDCTCQGHWVYLKDVPKQPYQQWFNWSCLLTPLIVPSLKFKWPFRSKIWVVPDEAEDNIIEH